MSNENLENNAKTPWHLWLAGILGSLWMAGGCFDYFMTKTKNAAYLENFTAEQLEFFYGFPLWANMTWAIAVWGSLLACILLLFRSRFSYPLFVVALLCQLANLVFMYGLSGGIELIGGVGGMIFTAAITLISIFFVWYSRLLIRRGVLR